MSTPEALRLEEVARSAWPRIPSPPGAFAAHLDAQAASGLPEARAVDLYLAWSCARGEAAALAAFDDKYGRHLAAIAGQAGLARAAIDDVVQQIRVRLLVGGDGEPPRIAQYAARGDLLSWLRIAVLRLAILVAGREKRAAGDPDPLEQLAAPALDPEARVVLERNRAAFHQAFAAALAALPPPDRAVLRYHYLESMTEAQIAGLMKLHRVTVARRLAAARARLLEGTRDELRRRLLVPTAELDSVMRAAHGEVAITLRRVLQTRPDT